MHQSMVVNIEELKEEKGSRVTFGDAFPRSRSPAW